MRLFAKTGWTRLAITLTAVAALGLAGCSDDDSSSGSGGSAGMSSGGSAGMSSGGSAGQTQDMDIVDTAVAAGSFNTLVAAVQAAGLEETLRSGTFTVFAPTDAAFEALPEGTVDTLLKPENKDQLVAILTYHAVVGEVPAADVVNLDKATTVNGADVTIEVVDGKVILNGTVEVTMTDIEASNGIIHVIDGVLLPPEG
ncbi:MAG: fasciclin domain-containing protein [Polyangiaceae bacterium]|nr:fasciclin domain-containing protein [Myxococcales bacterium]MCB9585922.1 fasciclin domain-containing protein [Polyangiaceae bacterium]MCB9607148.1 fasciclin domain-containing protein [Polyangiaceae bacterium]